MSFVIFHVFYLSTDLINLLLFSWSVLCLYIETCHFISTFIRLLIFVIILYFYNPHRIYIEIYIKKCLKITSFRNILFTFQDGITKKSNSP